MADLASLQQWLQQTILAGDADSLAPVRQSNRLPAAARVSVYVNGYRLRLIECLQKEFPMLRRLLGEHPFDLLARAYVELNPSHSYTLYEFGAGFAAYLAARQPPGLGDIAGMPAALARIERAKAEVFRARGHKAAAAGGGHAVPAFLGGAAAVAAPAADAAAARFALRLPPDSCRRRAGRAAAAP